MTTKNTIKEWIDRAKPEHTHMIVICDTFDYSDFPVYVTDDVKRIVSEYRNDQMTKVMEVYDLRKQIEPQLNETRAFNY